MDGTAKARRSRAQSNRLPPDDTVSTRFMEQVERPTATGWNHVERFVVVGRQPRTDKREHPQPHE
eukprot:1741063-Prorocentrum_lima.AAC.1